MIDQIPDISDAEWRVMNAIWQEQLPLNSVSDEPDDSERQQVTARVITQRLQDTTDWTPGTIKTLLHRLVQKGVLDFQRKGKRYLYSANYSQSECVDRAGHQLLHTVFSGRPLPMITYLVETARLSGTEVESLRELLDDIRKELPPHKPRR